MGSIDSMGYVDFHRGTPGQLVGVYFKIVSFIKKKFSVLDFEFVMLYKCHVPMLWSIFPTPRAPNYVDKSKNKSISKKIAIIKRGYVPLYTESNKDIE